MNIYLLILGVACGCLGITVGIISLVYAELTTGDIARFTPEQQYTFAGIKNKVAGAESNNTSSLSNEDFEVMVMDAFIRKGYTYCNDVTILAADGGLFCNDVDQNHTKQDKFFNEKFNEIKSNKPGPLASLGKLFGFK
jgi:hypothetical protein